MLELETQMKNYFNFYLEKNPETKPEEYDECICCLYRRAFKSTNFCSKSRKTGNPHIVCREKNC